MVERSSVLITGAGGFIGGRMVEMFYAMGYDTRAGVRRWGSGARVGRLPVDIVMADVMRPETLDAAMLGRDAVIHCAVGPRETTVVGTRNVLAAAERAKIKRVIHISTIDAYGPGEGEFEEQAPLTTSGVEYGDSKVEAEREVQAAVKRGLPVTVLRPTLVYGPFSESWTIEWAQRLQARPWLLSASDCQGLCNLVYVDDLVRTAQAALESPDAAGEAFNVNGPDVPTWQGYFEALSKAMGLPPLTTPSAATSHLSAYLMQPVRSAAKLALAKFEGPIMALYQRNALAKRMMKIAEGAIRKTPTTGEFRLLSRKATFPVDKANKLLGYAPDTRLDDGVQLSVSWLRHHGYLLHDLPA